MEHSCAHCQYHVNDNFCSNCGQKKFKRIDRKYVWDEVQYLILHTNKGFLYSVKNIIKNPGRTAKEFITGDRVNHYKPLLLTFVLSGISAFIAFKIIGLNHLMTDYYASQHINSQFMNDYSSFTSSYNSLIMLALVPMFALFTWLAFKNWGQNYYEHVVMNAYILSFYTLINFVLSYPLIFFFKNNINAIVTITSLSMFTIPFILIWFFAQFYKDKSLKAIIGRVLLTMIMVVLGFFVIIIIVMIIGIIFALLKGGPEALEYMKPK